MIIRFILLLALSSFLFSGIGRADDPKLPGSAVKIEYAVAKSDAIFIGEISTVGFVGSGVSGKPDQMGAMVTNVDGLQGSVNTSPWDTSVSFTISDIAHEVPPKEGSSYVFCVTKNAQGERVEFMAIKIVPATDDNIALVKNLVAKLPKK